MNDGVWSEFQEFATKEQIENIFPFRGNIAANATIDSLKQGTYLEYGTKWNNRPSDASSTTYAIITVTDTKGGYETYRHVKYLNSNSELFEKFSNGPWLKIATIEEGTWTPELKFGGNNVGMTYDKKIGKYIKIGKFVYFEAEITLTNKGSSTGNAVITGLPFIAGGNRFIPINRLRINFPSGGIDLKLWINNDGASLFFYSSSASGATSDLIPTNAEFLNNSAMYICGTYMTN